MDDTLAARQASDAACDADAAWRQLHRAATDPYRAAGRFAWYFARGKLGRDPVFRALVERGLLARAGHAEQELRVLDLGCGQGLIASLLQACSEQRRHRQWPAHWQAPRALAAYTGVELMASDIARAERALGSLAAAPRFVHADMRTAALPRGDLVVILDVLHYIEHDDQRRLLERVRDSLAPDGRLLLRIGDTADRSGWRASQWVDRVVTRLRGHRAPPTWGRTLAEWTALLEQLGFDISATLPMSQGTLFANVLLVADSKPAAA